LISIICVFNNKTILEKHLLKSLGNQTNDYELIFLNNEKNQYACAAEALNEGGQKAKGEYLLFVHQDMELGSATWLEEAGEFLKSLPDLGVAGVAGKPEFQKGVMTNLRHGNPPELAGEIQINGPRKVQTVDECLAIIPRSLFNKVQFDEKACFDWHLYVVDYCLTVKTFGYATYVLPLPGYHRSTGAYLSDNYYLTLKNVISKHKSKQKKIHTTVHVWKTGSPIRVQIFLKSINLKINKSLHLMIVLLEFCRLKEPIKSLLAKLLPQKL